MTKDKKAAKGPFMKVLRHGGEALTFRDVLIYSALVYRSRKGKGASQAWIGRFTSLSAAHSVRNGLVVLERVGLAHRVGSKWHAIQPLGKTEAWFSLKKAKAGAKDVAWQDQFAYTRMQCRAVGSPLTLHQHFIYSLLLSLQAARKSTSFRQSANGLTKLTGFDRHTITSALKALESHKLIDRTKKGFVHVLEPTEDQRCWWQQPKPAASQVPAAAAEQPPQSVERFHIPYNQPVLEIGRYPIEIQERIKAFEQFKNTIVIDPKVKEFVEREKPISKTPPPPEPVMVTSQDQLDRLTTCMGRLMTKAGLPEDLIHRQINEVAHDRISFLDWHSCFERARDRHAHSPKGYKHCGGLLHKFVKDRKAAGPIYV